MENGKSCGHLITDA